MDYHFQPPTASNHAIENNEVKQIRSHLNKLKGFEVVTAANLGENFRRPVVHEEDVPDVAELRIGQDPGEGFGDPLPQKRFRLSENLELAVFPSRGFLLVLAPLVQVLPQLKILT